MIDTKYIKVELGNDNTKVGTKRYRVDMVEREDGVFYEYMMWLVTDKTLSLFSCYAEIPAEEYPAKHEETLAGMWEMVKRNARVKE